MKSQNKTPKKNSSFKDFRPPGRYASLSKRQLLATNAIERLKKEEPNPKCELYYHTPYQLLVSVVLSAQTTDKMVNRAMEPLYKKGFDPEKVLRWGQVKLLEKIRTIGLAPTKSKNVLKLSQMIIDDHKGQIPSERKQLEALPGVGKKTASVILGEIFRHPTLAVDTHVYRVGMRLGLHKESSPDKAESVLLEVVDPKFLPDAHHWFILLGRYTCKSAKPLCEQCKLSDICPTFTPKKKPL